MKRSVAIRYFIYIALIAGLLGMVSSASAQTVVAKIPFAFTANHESLPAGDYQLNLLTPQTIRLADCQTGMYKGFLVVRPESEVKVEGRSRLIFLHSGARYYLKEVRISGFKTHSEVSVPSSLERELAMQGSEDDPTVEIALR